jgi:hypothetical protein
MKSSDYTRCPECQKRRVLFHFGRNGEDFLECHTQGCGWTTFRFPERGDSVYGPETTKWEELNVIEASERWNSDH